jgi:predicted membrane chloride channel (bestrophin family)
MEHDWQLFFSALSPWKAAILLVILPTAVTMVGSIVVRRIFGLERLVINNEVAGFKFAVVGIVYGLFLTLATISAWEKFSEAHVAVIEEAAAANAIYQLTNEPEQDQLAVRGALNKYLMLAELYTYFIRLIKKTSVAPAQNMVPAQTKATGRAQKVAAVPAPNEVMAQALAIELIKQLDNITKSRRTRVHLSSGIVPNMMWCVLIVGATLTVVFTFFFGLANTVAQVLMTGILAAMIFMSILMTLSFDHPFTGPVQVGPEALKDLLKTFAHS